MRIETKGIVKQLNGKPFYNSTEGQEVLTFGEAIAEMLATAEEKGAMKLYILATKFLQNDVVEVDKADLELVKKVVEASKRYFPVVKGQVLVFLDDVKSDGKEKVEEKS